MQKEPEQTVDALCQTSEHRKKRRKKLRYISSEGDERKRKLNYQYLFGQMGVSRSPTMMYDVNEPSIIIYHT